MLKPQIKEILESVNVTPFGRALQEYLDEQYEIINDVQACTSWEDTLGRKHAIKVLENLFAFMRVKNVHIKSGNKYE